MAPYCHGEPAAQPAAPARGRSRRRRRLPPLAYVFLTAAGAFVLAAVAGAFGDAEPVVLFIAGLVTLLALIASVCLRHPSKIWPWAAIAVALALFLVGGVLRAELQVMGDLTANRSLLPDLVTLPGYALLALGLLGFARQGIRDKERQSAVVLDGLLAALALAAVAWVFVIQRALLQNEMPLSVTLVMIAYPSMSVFMVVVTLRIVLDPYRERVPAVWLLFAGMSLMFAGDIVYLFADLGMAAVSAPVLDLPYALAYLCAGACALHPTMRRLTEPGREGRPFASRFRIALVAVALLIPAVLMLEDRGSTLAERVVLSGLMLAMTATAVLRLVQALNTAQQSETRLTHQARHDSLTGLPNRRMMEEHLSHLLSRAPIDHTHVALLYLDLDRFKLINDTLGHGHGDDLLIEVADRLRRHVRPTDLVTRIGGDEFMIVLGHVVGVSEAVDLANRLRACLGSPFVVRGMSFYVSASIGLAFASGEDPLATAEVLIRDADTAMYQAKDAGRDAVAVFDESMRTAIAERVELERDLHRAIARNQMHVVYQPIVHLPGGNVVGMEALARWAHPAHGVIPPAKFIPLAEESGMISVIGEWVLEQAVSQLAAWRRQSPDMASLYMSVNLSGVQLHDEGIVQRVADVLAMSGLEGSSLCLELTESVVMDDPAAAARTLQELRQLGVHLAIDDFGSEYSSLAYLRRFPVTMLKIDRSFVATLSQEDSPDATLIKTIVAMAEALDITTVAEGVEQPAQADRLRELGCYTVQGFLYSRPVGADRLPEVVASLGVQHLRLVTS
jgi:diguanylate cyclase (GGDEF)-like protein